MRKLKRQSVQATARASGRRSGRLDTPANPESSTSDASAAMVALIEASWLSKAIYVVASLGIPDLIDDRPKRSEELAVLTGTHAQSLHRIMRALVVHDIFTVDQLDRFCLTPLGATLRTDVPGSLRDWALLMLGTVNQAAWGEIIYTMRTGGSAFQRRHGVDLWQYQANDHEYAGLFAAAMASFTATYINSVLGCYRFAPLRRIVDVGGGDGSLLIGILQQYPEIKGVVFDLPEIVDRAKQRINEVGLSNRCDAACGDALVEVPSGGDAYILSRVLHDWDDESARRILTNCRNALPVDGRILVIERAMPDNLTALNAARTPALSDITMTDLNMMVMTSGRERTIAEYQDLFGAVGLELSRVVPTDTAMNVIELRALSRWAPEECD